MRAKLRDENFKSSGFAGVASKFGHLH